jgi:hypothetical protein
MMPRQGFSNSEGFNGSTSLYRQVGVYMTEACVLEYLVPRKRTPTSIHVIGTDVNFRLLPSLTFLLNSFGADSTLQEWGTFQCPTIMKGDVGNDKLDADLGIGNVWKSLPRYSIL